MQKIGDILSRSNEQIGQVMKVRQNWKEIAGELMSVHSEPVVIKKRVLLVMCDSPAWAQQIGMLTKVLEKQVKDITGIKIVRAEGKFGHVRKHPQKDKTVQTVRKPDIDPQDMKWLKDPKLAEAVRELINLQGRGHD
jgi:predicted nucleic acid-binding Zn ribbon protein